MSRICSIKSVASLEVYGTSAITKKDVTDCSGLRCGVGDGVGARVGDGVGAGVGERVVGGEVGASVGFAEGSGLG